MTDIPAPIALQRPGTLRTLLRCYRHLKPYRRLIVIAYLAIVAVNGLNLFIPQILRFSVDEGMSKGDLPRLGQFVLVLLGLTLVKGGLTFLQGSLIEKASQGVAYDMRNLIHQKLASLSFSYHDKAQTGQLLSRTVQDVERIRFLTGRASMRIFEGLFLLLGTFVVLLVMNPLLAVLAMASMPILIMRALTFSRYMRPLSISIQNQLAVLTTRLEQNLRGTRVVKAFAQEAAEIDRFERDNLNWFDLSARAARLEAVNAPLLSLIANLGTVFIILFGGLLIIRGSLTLGELVAFTTYLSLLNEPARRMGRIIPILAIGAAGADRIFEVLDAQSEVIESPTAQPLPPVRGQVGFENVSFAYFGRHKVLEDITFEAKPGQITALLGATGSGKSTIINLLPRFYDPVAGRITIDGVDLRDVTLTSLRDQIGIVLQETMLFAATVRENIAFGRPDASEEEVMAAAKAAQAHDFICELAEGYETKIGERGATLSGGQRQRIAIARALLKEPRILILDDATASVDSETERLIQQALEKLMRGRTSFVIAQRLSTLQQADQILVLEKGRVAARGTHEELLYRSSLYAEIYAQHRREEATQ